MKFVFVCSSFFVINPTIINLKKIATMGMYGPNDALGAAGYNTSGGCMSVIVVLIAIGIGTGLWIAF